MTEKVVCITGSGRERIGAAIARDFAKRGYRLALHYHRSAEGASQLAKELQEKAADARCYQADVSDLDSVQELFAAVTRDFGRLDALVTTASIFPASDFDRVDEEDLLKNFRINSLGTFYPARCAADIMCAQAEGGAIVTFGDAAIYRPYAGYSAYFISKGAIPTMTRMLAVECAERNPKVRVNCIEPGPVLPPEELGEQQLSQLKRATLTRSVDGVDSVVQAVQLFVESSFITGSCLKVDGGRHSLSPLSIPA